MSALQFVWFSLVGFLLHALSALLCSYFSRVRMPLNHPKFLLRMSVLRLGATESAVCSNALFKELRVCSVERFRFSIAILFDKVALKSSECSFL